MKSKNEYRIRQPMKIKTLKYLMPVIGGIIGLFLFFIGGFCFGRKNALLAEAVFSIHADVAVLSSVRNGEIERAIQSQERFLARNANELLRRRNAILAPKSLRGRMEEALGKFRKYACDYEDAEFTWPEVMISDEARRILSNAKINELEKQNKVRSLLNQNINKFLDDG